MRKELDPILKDINIILNRFIIWFKNFDLHSDNNFILREFEEFLMMTHLVQNEIINIEIIHGNISVRDLSLHVVITIDLNEIIIRPCISPYPFSHLYINVDMFNYDLICDIFPIIRKKTSKYIKKETILIPWKLYYYAIYDHLLSTCRIEDIQASILQYKLQRL